MKAVITHNKLWPQDWEFNRQLVEGNGANNSYSVATDILKNGEDEINGISVEWRYRAATREGETVLRAVATQNVVLAPIEAVTVRDLEVALSQSLTNFSGYLYERGDGFRDPDLPSMEQFEISPTAYEDLLIRLQK